MKKNKLLGIVILCVFLPGCGTIKRALNEHNYTGDDLPDYYQPHFKLLSYLADPEQKFILSETGHGWYKYRQYVKGVKSPEKARSFLASNQYVSSEEWKHDTFKTKQYEILNHCSRNIDYSFEMRAQIPNGVQYKDEVRLEFSCQDAGFKNKEDAFNSYKSVYNKVKWLQKDVGTSIKPFIANNDKDKIHSKLFFLLLSNYRVDTAYGMYSRNPALFKAMIEKIGLDYVNLYDESEMPKLKSLIN